MWRIKLILGYLQNLPQLKRSKVNLINTWFNSIDSYNFMDLVP